MTRPNHHSNLKSGQTKRRPSYSRRVNKGKEFWEKRERAQAKEVEERRKLEAEKEEAEKKLAEEQKRYIEFKKVII